MHPDAMSPGREFGNPAARGAVVGIGMDLVEIARIEESLAKFGDRFLHRLFSKREIADIQMGGVPNVHAVAMRFAAKEAALKALDLTLVGVDWRELEVTRGCNGRYELHLGPSVASKAARPSGDMLALAMSHVGRYATAAVIAYEPDPIATKSSINSQENHE
jgi:holo-[acyl-carrier protein] synthase